MLRLIAAVFVFAGHMGLIQSGEALLIGIHGMHEMGVWILFLIGGYLVAKSWQSDPHPLRFALRRFFRLWPPFAVMVLIMTFITGPLLSDLGVKGYFESGWFQLYLMNLRFFPVFAQPGVFINVIQVHVTNGSVWTMPVEVFAYLVTPVLMCLYGLGIRKHGQDHSFHLALFVTAAAVVFDLYLRIYCADTVAVFYGTELLPAYHLIVMYLIGMLFTFGQMRKYLNLEVACVGVLLLYVFKSSGVLLQYLLVYLVVPYAVFSFAFEPRAVFSRFGRRMELSYGIYLYGFFFQQLVVLSQNRAGIALSYTKTLVLSAIPPAAAAVLSFYLVDKPALRLCRSLLAKQKDRERK